jgi:ABC-type sugar transport system ATPase subunit
VATRLEIAKLHQQLAGSTMIYVTHDQVEAMTLADKIVVLRKGVVEQIGAPMDLYDRPVNLFVAGFIGSPKMNFITLSGSGANRALPDGTRLAVGGDGADDASTLGLRADQVAVVPAGMGQFDVTVSVVERLGDSEFVYVQTSWGQELVIRAEGGANTPVGETVGLNLAGRTHFFDAEGLALPGVSLTR